MTDQNFTHTFNGTEPGTSSDFVVNLPETRPNPSYYVSGYVSSPGRIVGVDFPASQRTTTALQVVTTAPLVVGDTIELHVYDPTQATTVTIPIGASSFGIETGVTTADTDGIWTVGGSSVLTASLPIPVGCRLLTVSLACTRGGSETVEDDVEDDVVVFGTGTITATITKRTIGLILPLNRKTVLHTLTVNAGSGWTIVTTPTLNHIVAANSLYYVRVTMDSSAQGFSGVIVKYDVP